MCNVIHSPTCAVSHAILGVVVTCSLSAGTVHGFDQVVYMVEEDKRLDTVLVLNVKGETRVLRDDYNFPGTIFTEAAGTAGKSILSLLSLTLQRLAYQHIVSSSSLQTLATFSL